MSIARQSFVDRVRAFKTALGEPALISRTPTDTDHNNTAQLLRNGLAVVGFAMLEDFIRARLAEVLARVGNANVPFEDLPDPLKEASVYGAVRAVAYHADLKRRQGDDYLSFLQQHSRSIASTASASYQLSGMALGWDRPNLTHDEVKEVLRAFKVQDGWGNIDRLASRVGLGMPSLRDAFRQAALGRHRAAHAAGTDTELAHLIAFAPQAIAVAIGFDALLSRSLRRLLDRDAAFLADSGSVQEADVTIRYLDDDGACWREIKEGGTRAVKRDVDLDALTAACLARPDAHGDLVVVRDRSQQPVRWYIQSVA